MTLPIAYPLVQGVRHSFASIECVFALGGAPTSATQTGAVALNFRGFKSIQRSRTRTRTILHGNHPDPIGKTRGKNEYKASVEILLAEYNALQAAIQSAQAGYGDVFFSMIVSYSENGFDTITDTVIGCTFDTTEASDSDGTEGTMRKIELNPLKILFNGLDDCAVPLAPAVAA